MGHTLLKASIKVLTKQIKKILRKNPGKRRHYDRNYMVLRWPFKHVTPGYTQSMNIQNIKQTWT